MRRAIPVLLVIAAAMVGATAALAVGPTWNHGYNGWWPGGFGYAPRTVHASGYPCSLTVYGPTFRSGKKGWSQYYGGGTSCAHGVGQKTLTVSEQVRGPNGTWHTLSGSTFTSGPSFGNPVWAIHKRAAFLGHAYRAFASAVLVVPNGHAGCSLTNTCNQTITLQAYSKPLAP